MRLSQKISLHREAAKIVFIYMLFGFAWIYFSDSVLGWLIHDEKTITIISIFKGLFFIVFTSCLLFFLISRLNNKIKQSTNELRESEERFRFLVKNSSDNLVILNADGSQRYVSPAAERITGFAVGELEGRKLETIIHPDDLPQVMTAWHEAIADPEKIITVEYRHIHKTKGWIFSEAIAQSFLNEPAINGIIASVRDITERKNSADMLRLRESYLSAIIENQPGLIWLKDTSGKFLMVNAEFAESCGLNDPQLLVGKTDLDVWPRDLAEKYIEDDTEILRSRKSLIKEEHILHKGEIRWFETFKTPVEDNKGVVIGSTGYARDITRRKQDEEALRKSESKLKTLVQTIPDLMWLKDENGVYLSCNRQFERLFGASQSEIIGKTDYDFVDQDLADFFREHDQKAVEAGSPSTNEEWITYADDGRHALLETIKTPMYDIDGALIGVLGIGRDITERKRMEEQLRESEDKFRLIFSSSPDAINIARLTDGLYVDINDGFTRIMGYTREDVVSKTSFELNIWDDFNDRDRFVEILQDDGYCENLEVVFRKKNGTLITCLMSARIIPINGEPHIICISRDISQHKQYEREMLKIEKLESLGILAGGIAHDFNNILTGIIGNTSLAKVHLEDGHAALKSITATEKAAVRAGELAHQLLTFAKGGEPIKKHVSPHVLLEESLSIVLSGSSVKAVVNISDTVHAFEADEGQLGQVFRNILLNAVQAMPGGGVITVNAGNIELSDDNTLSLPAGEYVQFTFEDEGTGIPQNVIPKVFDPYFTTKQTGNGLGLASAFSIVTRHGGHISISSVETNGTVVTVYLPSTGQIYSNEQDQEDPKKYGILTGGSVLVMDDEIVVLEIAESILNHLGFSVTTCQNGEKAVELYRQAFEAGNPFSIVILDLTIPGGMGGKQTAEKILAEFPEAHLIVSSGYSNDPIMSQYKEYGFIGAIKKPYTLDDFGASLLQIKVT